MNLTRHVVSVESRLTAAAQAGDEATRRTAGALAVALEPAIRLGILDALAEFAAEVSAELGDRVVELRLEAGEPRASVRPAQPSAEQEPSDDELAQPKAEHARLTLRLPERLKAEAEHAAALQGTSLNTWLVQAVRRALQTQARQARPATGARLRGWVQT